MKTIRPYIFLFCLFIFASCQKEDNRPVEVQEIHIKAGWNSFSTYLEISEDIETVFADHLDKIQLIRDPNDSSVYYPEGEIFTLSRIVFFKGYEIRARQDFILQLKGTVCQPEKIIFTVREPVDSVAGLIYTYIPYIRKTAMSPKELHDIIGDNLEIIKNEDGMVYWAHFGVDTIESLDPDESYGIRCSEETRFSFRANDV